MYEQEVLKSIFKLAKGELPHRVFEFSNEICVMFKGFKASICEGVYKFEDVRHSDYYEEVDPLIVNAILSQGFSKTLSEVMVHDDKMKVVKLRRHVINLNVEINHWVLASRENYAHYSNGEITKSKYQRKRRLYAKKRSILKRKRADVEADIEFYSNRIKMFQV